MKETFEKYEGILSMMSVIDHFVNDHMDDDIEDIQKHYKKYKITKEQAEEKADKLRLAKQKMEEALYWLNSAINEETKAFTVREYTTEFDEYIRDKYIREKYKM